MNAIDKIIRIAETVTADKGNAEALATKLQRGNRKSEYDILDVTDTNLLVATGDGEVFRVVQDTDKGFAAFAQYMGRKSSVLLPEMSKVAECPGWVFYKTEALNSLDNAVGEEVAANFFSWADRYINKRAGGERASRSKDYRPPDLKGLVNYGNLRGLLNKLIKFARDTGVRFNDAQNAFMVRDHQLVVANPMTK